MIIFFNYERTKYIKSSHFFNFVFSKYTMRRIDLYFLFICVIAVLIYSFNLNIVQCDIITNDNRFIVQSNRDVNNLENIYTKFENSMNQFAEFNEQMLNKPQNERLVIIYTPLLYSGLNNRLFAFVTSFLMSFLTKRAFQSM